MGAWVRRTVIGVGVEATVKIQCLLQYSAPSRFSRQYTHEKKALHASSAKPGNSPLKGQKSLFGSCSMIPDNLGKGPLCEQGLLGNPVLRFNNELVEDLGPSATILTAQAD